jgi:hypothetical protein
MTPKKLKCCDREMKICKISSTTEDMKNEPKNEASVTDDIPRSISSSRDEILLISEEFHLL